MRGRGVSAWLPKYNTGGRDGAWRPGSVSLCAVGVLQQQEEPLGSRGRTGISMHRSRRSPTYWGAKSIQQPQFLPFHNTCWLGPVSMCVLFAMQGEEGPPSLEYIQAKDLFPPKELVKEEESLQVRK